MLNQIIVIATLLILLPILALAVIWLIGERGHILGLPSTQTAIKGNGTGEKRRIGLAALHAYIYGRWTNQYINHLINIRLPRMDEKAKQHWADHYHGKVLTPELAKSNITLDHDIKRCDLEQVIPYPTARNIVLEGPPSVTIYECACRHARKDHCTSTQVCMIIGDGNFTLDHNPDSSKRISQQEAIDLLEAEHQRGHVHTAYFKDVCNDQFYAICNCCSCCCGGLEAMTKYNVPMLASSGYVAQIDSEMCIGCGDCETVCPFGAITVINDLATVIWDKCMGCSVCVGQCAVDAATLVLDERKGIPMDVRTIGV